MEQKKSSFPHDDGLVTIQCMCALLIAGGGIALNEAFHVTNKKVIWGTPIVFGAAGYIMSGMAINTMELIGWIALEENTDA